MTGSINGWRLKWARTCNEQARAEAALGVTEEQCPGNDHKIGLVVGLRLCTGGAILSLATPSGGRSSSFPTGRNRS